MLPAVLERAADIPGLPSMPAAATASLGDIVPLTNDQANRIQAQVPVSESLGRSPLREVIAVGDQAEVVDFYPDPAATQLVTVFSLVPVSDVSNTAVTAIDTMTITAWSSAPGLAEAVATSNGSSMTYSNIPVGTGCDVLCFLADVTVGLAALRLAQGP
jgi:hypothetical protein